MHTHAHIRELPDTNMQNLLAVKGEDLWTFFLVIFFPNLISGMSLSMKVPKRVEDLFQGLTAFLKGHLSSPPKLAILMQTL